MASLPPELSPDRPALVRAFQSFFATESAGGIVLLVCAVVALVLANSPLAGAYFALWDTPVTAAVGPLEISKPLLLWINDGLMALFFFLVGLEIKREVLNGELRRPKQAALALAGAVGGMVVPAGLYLAFNAGGPGANGWALPMATDIAFALGVLALLGTRAPFALKVFLTALAIVDDLGAVIVIALFYTSSIKASALAVAAGAVAALVAANRLGVQRTAVYVLLGIVLWVAVLKSGVHATLAGVVAALTIPADRRLDVRAFTEHARSLLDRIMDFEFVPDDPEPTPEQQDAIHALEAASVKAETPLVRMEHALHGWVAFGIMPLFALANAGVALGGGPALEMPIVLGVVVGLLVGKPVGVVAMAWLAIRTGLARMPRGVTWRHLVGVGFLTGIGFTMALFIGSLAFADPAQLASAKVGILSASVLSGVIGAALIWSAGPPPASPAPAEAAAG